MDWGIVWESWSHYHPAPITRSMAQEGISSLRRKHKCTIALKKGKVCLRENRITVGLNTSVRVTSLGERPWGPQGGLSRHVLTVVIYCSHNLRYLNCPGCAETHRQTQRVKSWAELRASTSGRFYLIFSIQGKIAARQMQGTGTLVYGPFSNMYTGQTMN